MKVALVYDRVTKWGGAERVLLALHKLWPDAPLYTAVYDKSKALWANEFIVRPSFLQRIPFANKFHELLPLLTPLAFEQFNFDDFDVVITVSSAEAKSIITKPNTLHICYCLTPTRYLWSGYDEYTRIPGIGSVLQKFSSVLKKWDTVASSRPDYYIAISEHVNMRIERYYKRKSYAVIYPPVVVKKQNIQTGEYFLVVSRLVAYKKIDVIIDAFNELGLPLVIIGNGHDKDSLKMKAKSNVTFIDHHLTDSELVGYYQACRAFVYAADEDFGLAAAEAQTCGKPVIAYSRSGVAEIVIHNKTGILYDTQTKEALQKAIETFETKSFDSYEIINHSKKFQEEIFLARIKKTVQELYNTYI